MLQLPLELLVLYFYTSRPLIFCSICVPAYPLKYQVKFYLFAHCIFHFPCVVGMEICLHFLYFLVIKKEKAAYTADLCETEGAKK